MIQNNKHPQLPTQVLFHLLKKNIFSFTRGSKIYLKTPFVIILILILKLVDNFHYLKNTLYSMWYNTFWVKFMEKILLPPTNEELT